MKEWEEGIGGRNGINDKETPISECNLGTFSSWTTAKGSHPGNEPFVQRSTVIFDT